MATHQLDVRGTCCPVPLLLTGRHARALEPGDELLVVGDDPEMGGDIARWCEQAGHRVLGVVREGRLVSLRLEIGGQSQS